MTLAELFLIRVQSRSPKNVCFESSGGKLEPQKLRIRMRVPVLVDCTALARAIWKEIEEPEFAP